MEFEQEFEVRIPDGAMENISTVKQAIDCIEKSVAGSVTR